MNGSHADMWWEAACLALAGLNTSETPGEFPAVQVACQQADELVAQFRYRFEKERDE